MPGIPQGRDIGESGPKSVTLASVLDDGSIALEERIVSLAQFERVGLDASGTATWHDLVARLDTSLQDAATRSVSDHLVVRLAISGTTPLAWNMRRDADLLRTEAETRAKSLGDVWIDKLEIDCRRTQAGATASTDQLDALRKTMNDEVAASECFRNEATDTVKELLAQLPPECRRAIAPDEAALEDLVARLAVEGAEEVLARLSIGDSDGAR